MKWIGELPEDVHALSATKADQVGLARTSATLDTDLEKAAAVKLTQANANVLGSREACRASVLEAHAGLEVVAPAHLALSGVC